ncbi:MAG TPA: aminotransferase class V-fold PLP-dependent enzyme [Gemmatimonadales bacterium]|nr:aminotransferase class V-fold PLP-dependent enzyme [Gemmatimonadales bacterium]
MRPPGEPAALAAWRADTPGTARRIHLNNAGAAMVPTPVRRAVDQHLDLEDELGGYEAKDARADALQLATGDLARLLGVRPRNVAWSQNSTTAFAQALSAFDFRPGDRIVTSRADYASNQIMYLSLARRHGVEIVRAPDRPAGGVDPEAVRRLIRQRRPALTALTWIPTNSGLVQDAAAVGAVCREAEVPYLVDACQAVGQMPVDVAAIGCDYLAGTSRKFLRGPRGIGFLVAADRVLEAGAYPLLVDMHGADWAAPDRFELTPDARRFESWEIAQALVLGAGAAVRYALDIVGIETARDRAWALAAYARELLAELPGVRVLDQGAERCAIVTVDPAGRSGPELKLALRQRGINVSSPSREDAVIDMDQKGVSSALRISPHYYNTAAEVEAAVAALGELLNSR